MEISNQNIKGGAYLISQQLPSDTYIREDITEDAKQFASMIDEFVEKKIAPNFAILDKHDNVLLRNLLKESADLGIMSAPLPEEYGGMGVDFNTESAMSEEIGKSHSFSVAYSAHTGIGTLPILYFGTADQKNKYLTVLGSGEKFASYCLTEPWSGSDALGARTKAVLSEDGQSYILNGQKMWITNAGFADMFIVFAQVDGDKFTGFIVDRNTPGLTIGAEEDKLGIKGSSTCQVFLENVTIPKENLLGEIGKGHKIAFNVLNIGRYKLCVMTLGSSKRTFNLAVNYANERIQFHKKISEFGAIQEKIANMAMLIYITDSATYRVSGWIENSIEQLVKSGIEKPQAKLKSAEEYSIECAILKVIGSETLDYVCDEAVQIYGGMGYSEEAPVARCYRDSRINRIFEGTNEINRLLAVGTLMKKALKGELNLLEPAMAVQKELMDIDMGGSDDTLFGAESKAVDNAKKAILLTAGAAMKHYKQDIENQQELMMAVADMMIYTFGMESTLLRVQKLVVRDGIDAHLWEMDIVRTAIVEGLEQINILGRRVIQSFAEGDVAMMMNMGLKRFTKFKSFNTIAAKRNIARHFIEKNQY